MPRVVHTTLPRRRGSTAILAMLFITLFAALAIGLVSTVSTSVNVAGNEQRTARAMLACDSGMQFMKYHLATLGIPANTPTGQLFNQVYQRLGAKLNNYPNMPVNARTIELEEDGTLIRIPRRPEPGALGWIGCDGDGGGFRAEVRKLQAGEKIEVRVYGRHGGNYATSRGLKLEYANFPNPAAIFNYGVASKSKISMNGNVTIRGTPGNEHMGSVLSAHTVTNVPLTMTGSPQISGHVSFVNGNATPSISSTAEIAERRPGQFGECICPTVGCTAVVHYGVTPPEFPTVDTTAFQQYVPSATATGPGVITSGNPSGTTFKNIRIKAGANPTFNANTTIQGVILIEQPNQVKFNGGVTIQGVIVTPVDGNNNDSLDVTANVVEFKGGATFQSVSTLPATSDFPASMRSLTGSTLLVPGFTAKFGGNFNTIGGTIIASQMNFSGTAGGIIKGSVINLKDTAVSLAGTSDIIIESQGTGNYPAGVFFGRHYEPLPFTYEEFNP